MPKVNPLSANALYASSCSVFQAIQDIWFRVEFKATGHFGVGSDPGEAPVVVCLCYSVSESCARQQFLKNPWHALQFVPWFWVI